MNLKNTGPGLSTNRDRWWADGGAGGVFVNSETNVRVAQTKAHFQTSPKTYMLKGTSAALFVNYLY